MIAKVIQPLMGFLVGFVVVILLSKDFYLAVLVAIVIFVTIALTSKHFLPVGLVFGSLYLYLFVFRYLVLLKTHQQSQLGRVVVPIESLRSILILISESSLLFLIIFFVCKRKRNSNIERVLMLSWLASRQYRIFINLLYFFTLSGFLVLVAFSGGLNEVTNLLFFHQKNIYPQNAIWQIGLTLWSLFSIPALTLDLLGFLNSSYKGVQKFRIMRSFLMIAILIGIFGGRLSIFISILITISFAIYFGWPLKKSWAPIGVLFFVLFLIVGNVRTGNSTDLRDFKQVTISATYPVLDAAALVIDNPSGITNQLASKDRYMAYLKSLVPRFIWPNKPLLTDFTLDSQLANEFGWENQRGVTGWPSGYVTEPYLLASTGGVFLYVILLAFVLAFLIRIQSARSKILITGTGFVRYFCIIYSLIAIIKDGDTFASMQSGIRLFVWLYLVLKISDFLANNRIEKLHG